MDNNASRSLNVDPHLHAARNLAAMLDKAVATGMSCWSMAEDDDDQDRAKRDAVTLATMAWHELWLLHLSDMQARYGSAYGPWLYRDRSRRRRRAAQRQARRRP